MPASLGGCRRNGLISSWGVLALSVSKEGVPCFPPFLYPGNAQIIRQIAKIRGYGCGDCSQAGRPEDLPFSMQDKGNERV